MTARTGSRAAALLLLAGSLALALGGAELVLRWLERPGLRGPLAWTTTVEWNEGTNSLDFRGKQPKRRKRADRILLLGDSQLEGYHVKLGDTFGIKLQQYLRHRDWPVEVVALGAGGWGTDQQLIALRMYIDELEPDLVVVFYTHRNDIWNALFPTHLGTPKPTYRLIDGELVAPDPALWLPPEAHAETPPPYGLLPTLRRLLAGGYPSDLDWEATLPPRTPAPPAAPDLLVLAEVYEKATGRELWDEEDMQSERSHFAHLKQPATPRQLYALELQRALYTEMARECAARGIPLLVFRPRLTLDHWEGEFAHEGRAYTLSSSAASARLRGVFEASGVPLLEIDDVRTEHTWLPQDRHLNPAGNRFVAQQVGDWLLEQRATASPE